MKRKRKSNAGRKPKWNDTIVQKLEEFFRLDCTDEEACGQAGISTSAFYERMKKDSAFMEKIRKAQRFPMILMKKTVIQAANAGDGNLALKVLERRQRDRYTPKLTLEHEDEKPSIHVHLSDKMTPDDARQFLNSVLKR